MPTQVYKNKKGERVKSVTTIIGKTLGWNKDPLMAWQAREFKKGFDIFKGMIRSNPSIIDTIESIPNDPTDKKQRAASIGDLCHHYISMDFYQKPIDEEYKSKYSTEAILIAERSIKIFKKKIEELNVDVIGSEIALVSEQYQYGGCIDGRLIRRGTSTTPYTYLQDTKSGNGIYADHIIQLGAYDNLLIENEYSEPDEYLFVHINKDPVITDEDNIIKFIVVPKEIVKAGFEVFKLLIQVDSYQKSFNEFLQKIKSC